MDCLLSSVLFAIYWTCGKEQEKPFPRYLTLLCSRVVSIFSQRSHEGTSKTKAIIAKDVIEIVLVVVVVLPNQINFPHHMRI